MLVYAWKNCFNPKNGFTNFKISNACSWGLLLIPDIKLVSRLRKYSEKLFLLMSTFLTFWSSRPTCYNDPFEFCQLKYLKFESSGCKDKGIRKLESAASIQFFS